MTRACIVLFVSLFAVGCGAKIKFEKTDEIESGQTKPYFSTAPSDNHKVKVELTGDEPVSVYVFMASDVNKDDPDSTDMKKALGKAERSKTISLDVTIPKKEEFTVEVNALKKAKYTIKINSQ